MVTALIDIKERYIDISIKGHANYSSAGFDIVCASISVTVYNFESIWNNFGFGGNFDISEGNTNIKLPNNNYFIQKILLKSFIEILQKIESEYPQYIEVVINNANWKIN